jgi:hypothetical protein
MVQFPQVALTDDIRVPGNDPGHLRGEYRGSQMGHGIGEMQVDEVERLDPVLPPGFQKESGRKGKTAIHVPARHPDDGHARQEKAASHAVAGRHQIDEIHVVAKTLQQAQDMSLNPPGQVIAETAETKYAHGLPDF